MCVCVGGGGEGFGKFLHANICLYAAPAASIFFLVYPSCCQHFFISIQIISVFQLLQTICFKIFQPAPLPPPTPPKKKIGLSLRRSEIMLKLNPGRRHLSMNTSQSGSSMKD